MTDRTTSLPAANSLHGEWRRFGDFVNRPRLPDNVEGFGPAALARVLRFFALDIILILTLVAIALVVIAAGVELPKTALADMELNATLVVAAVIFAPLMEELLFRGWLSGRPGAVGAVIALLVGGVGSAMVIDQGTDFSALGPAFLIALLALLVAIGLAFGLRKRPPWGLFVRFFPVFFWLSAGGFALVHVLNFGDEVPIYALLPLVLPQLVLGMLAAYLRVTIGLWAAILLHMLHNGLAIGVALFATQGAG